MNIRQLVNDHYMTRDEIKRQLFVPKPYMVLTPTPTHDILFLNIDTAEYETIDAIHVGTDESVKVYTEVGVYEFDHISMDLPVQPSTKNARSGIIDIINDVFDNYDAGKSEMRDEILRRIG